MSGHRFFAEPREGSAEALLLPGDHALPLSAADVHHLRDVLRLEASDEIVLVVDRHALRVLLTDVGEPVRGEVLGELAAPKAPRVTLVQGLAKGEKMDQIIRQVTELGVARVVPFAAERSVVRLDADKASARVDRWRRVAAEAAKQSQRNDVPTIERVAELSELPELLAGATVLVCWEEASAIGIAEALRTAGDAEREVAVVIGPEGGLAADEVRTLQDAGAVVASLGDTVLRTETAGVIACALVIHERGGLGAPHA